MMGSLETGLVDLMEPRRKNRDSIGFMTRHWRPEMSYRLEQPLTPQQLKEEVAQSLYIEAAIREEAERTGDSESAVRAHLLQILHEMGLERKMYVIRALGVAFIKTALSMRVGVFVNERRILQLKSVMGDNPVLFLPTHRSYADFCLMTYLCYHYDIHLPAVAAGMDFYHMAGMGRMMRDTCAFYIPRTLVGAPLRAAALRRYMRALVTRNPAPLEFFIEGARSRSNKSLSPKYGLLSMALLPLFTREVADVTIVPVSINYERVMEQTLFSYEHLGVPKPKESTRGLLKTISFLNDDFGNIYVNMGEPFSAKQFLGEVCSSLEPAKLPLELQELTKEQATQVHKLADHVLVKQQEGTVISTYNLIAIALMQSLVKGVHLEKEELNQEMEWLSTILRGLGTEVVSKEELSSSTERVLKVHRTSVRFDRQHRLRLLCPPLPPHTAHSMKGHQLEVSTMQTAVPVIQLQMYVNTAAYRLVPAAFLVAALRRAPLQYDELREAYEELRSLHKYEFVYSSALALEKGMKVCLKGSLGPLGLEEGVHRGRVHQAPQPESFTLYVSACQWLASGMEVSREQMESTLKFCVERDVIRHEPGSGFSLGEERLRALLDVVLCPSVHTLLTITHVVKEQKVCEQWQLLRLTQQRAESGKAHPYCLSLEAIKNLVSGLVVYGALASRAVTLQGSDKKETHYSPDAELLERAQRILRNAAPSPNPHVPFTSDNPVLMLETTSRL